MSAPNQWLDLYNNPDPGIISKLSAHDFRSFITYVFERAGYQVVPCHKPGADLELRNENRLEGYVAISTGVHNVGSPVQNLNGIPNTEKIEKYFVSAEDFAPSAYELKKEARFLFLLNDIKLLRYINYVRGTRHPKSRNAPLSPASIFDFEPQKRVTSQTRVMALANNKGGVCKTTSAFAIGLILAIEKKKKVLFVDLDEQANLTQITMPRKMIEFLDANLDDRANISRARKRNQQDFFDISDYFADFSTNPLATLIKPGKFDNTWIIPSSPSLRLTHSTTVDWTETERNFTSSLHHESLRIPNGGDFDWIIIDTPPALSLYTRSALIAAHYVLTPFTPSLLDQDGFWNLLETLGEIRGIASAGNQTEMLGCFATRWKRSTAAKADVERMKLIAELEHAPFYDAAIEEDTNLIRKLVPQLKVPNLATIHGALDDYRQLVKEIQSNVGDH